MFVRSVDSKINIWLLLVSLCVCEDALLKLSSRGVRADFPKACTYLRCKGTDRCVSRKFWCKHPPCPNMLYCSKSRMESLKGPSSCEDVRCSKGFVCHVRARHCRWDGVCEQQIARCVSERDYFEGPTSCIDFQCPSGRRCILRESLCVKTPCKLLKSCAETRDVDIWLQKCKNLGCQSEHECFLRRPDHSCSSSPCKHTPDCTSKTEQNPEMGEQCRGWVCPKGQVCSVHSKGPCKRESCKIFRSCHKPLMILEQKSTVSGRNRFSSNPTTDELLRSIGAAADEKNPLHSDGQHFNSTSREKIGKGSNSRLPPIGINTTSGQVVKPTAISLTTWLNHLKLITGIEAVETWIVRANRQENHEEFLEWLQSVKDMLGPDAYDLWLAEVRAMTVTSTAFQKWLSASPTNRSTDSHHLVRTDGNASGASYETFSGSENSNRNNDEGNDVQSKGNRDTAVLKNDHIKDAKYIFQTKNETPVIQTDVARDIRIPPLPVLPQTPTTIGVNDWSRLYHSAPGNFPQTQPFFFPRNFGNVGAWKNQGPSYEGIDNTALSNPSYPKFSPNWSFEPSPDDAPAFLGPKTWQDQYFPSVYPQWRQGVDPRDEISLDQRMFEPPIGTLPIFPPSMEAPVNFRPQNSTANAVSWIKSFDDRYDTPEFVAPKNFEAYPIADGNLAYPGWPESGYSPSLSSVAHRRTKHHGLEARNLPYDSKNVGESEAKIPGPSENPSLRYSGYPWGFKQPRLRDDYPRILDYSGRNLYAENNRKGSPVLPNFSRTHRVGGDRLLSPHNLHGADNRPGAPQSEHRWKSSYPHDQFHGIPGTSSPASVIPVYEGREKDRRISPSPKLDPFDEDVEDRRGLFVGRRVNDVPRQTMDLPDFWNSRYRNPTSSILRKIVREDYGNGGTISENRPSAKNSPPAALTTGKNVTPRVVSVRDENVSDEKGSNDDSKNFEDYSTEEDDGVYPLMLSLQGYIQSQSKQVFQDSSNPPKNSTILPVYTIDHGAGEDHYNDDYEALDEEEDVNFFRDENYGGRPDFPNNLKDVFEVEAASIMQNRTGDDDLRIKDIQWEYEYDDDSNNDDPPNSERRTQIFVSTANVSSKDDLARQVSARPIEHPPDGWVVNQSGAWNNDRVESDYYNDRDDYVDEDFHDSRSSIDSDQIDIIESSNHENLPDDHNDRFYGDTEHKTLKKNLPL